MPQRMAVVVRCPHGVDSAGIDTNRAYVQPLINLFSITASLLTRHTCVLIDQ